MRRLVILTAPLSLPPSLASAEGPNPPEWNEGWSRYDWPHGITTVAVGGAAFALFFAAPPNVPLWTEVNDFDGAARDALVLPTYSGRETMAKVTDAIFVSMLAFPGPRRRTRRRACRLSRSRPAWRSGA